MQDFTPKAYAVGRCPVQESFGWFEPTDVVYREVPFQPAVLHSRHRSHHDPSSDPKQFIPSTVAFSMHSNRPDTPYPLDQTDDTLEVSPDNSTIQPHIDDNSAPRTPEYSTDTLHHATDLFPIPDRHKRSIRHSNSTMGSVQHGTNGTVDDSPISINMGPVTPPISTLISTEQIRRVGGIHSSKEPQVQSHGTSHG